MLTILPAQMEALTDATFVRRLLVDLNAQFGDHLPSDDQNILRARLHEGVARGRSHGLTWVSSLGAFAIAQTILGAGFDKEPFIARVLTHPRLPPNRRMELLLAVAGPATWQEAKRRADARLGQP